MSKTILVIGGYGGVGKALVRSLLKYTDCEVVIGGRNLHKAKEQKTILLAEFTHATLKTTYLDASDKASLVKAFRPVDLAIVTATVPEYIELIAEAALEANIDLMDILLRGDVVDKISKFKERIIESGRIFITQCGFHPGLVAPLIRMAEPFFDEYQDANVAMAMDMVFEKPDSVKELLYEVIEFNSLILKNGKWEKAKYKDAKSFDFSDAFGRKVCFPFYLRELIGIERELGLSNCGVYAAGFSYYIDNIIFPLAIILGKVNRNASIKVCSKLFYKSIKHNRHSRQKVEMLLFASGQKDGKSRTVNLGLSSNDGFELTAIAVVALLNQYLAETILPGLSMMGKVLEGHTLFDDLKKMGVELVEIKQS